MSRFMAMSEPGSHARSSGGVKVVVQGGVGAVNGPEREGSAGG